MKNQKKRHFHLIAGSILVHDEDDGTLSTLTLNGMLRTDIKYLNVADIGKAQQVLQMVFHQRNQANPEGAPANFKIVDVVINNIMHLGHMTEAEFNHVPGGKLVERTGDNPFGDSSTQSLPN